MSDPSQKPQEDILSQIMNKDPSYRSDQKDQAEAGGDSPPQSPEKKTPQNKKQNQRSAVYVYLLVLFGAAFLMLLLAYFIQQRNNETTISDLRNSMTLSRDELLDEIEVLKEENEAIRQDNDLHEYEADHIRGLYEEQRQEIKELEDFLRETESLLINTAVLEYLERFCHEGDYLMAAVMVEQYDHFFNQHNKFYGNQALDPVQTARYMELREKVFEEAGCMILEQFITTEDGSEYTERPYIGSPSLYDEDTLATARELMDIFHFYVYARCEQSSVGELVLHFYDPESGNLERMNGRPFKASTAELFEQIKGSLIEEGIIAENADGTLTAAHTDTGEELTGGVSRETLEAPEAASNPPTE